MIREEIKQLKTGRRDLQKFGLMVGGVFLLLGLWFLYRHKAHYPFFFYPGAVLLVVGLFLPQILKPIYIGWMALAFTMGLIVSTVLLTIFFYLVVTPIGLAARCLGKDFLARKWDAETTTYWLRRNHSRSSQPVQYERQF